MLHQKILLNESNYSKSVKRKCNIGNDQSNVSYDVGNEIIYNGQVLESHLFDYNDAYILVRGDFTATAAAAIKASFKNCAPFIECITKIDGTTIDGVKYFNNLKI